MWTGEFEYLRPATVSEALQLMAEHEDAKILAGGHSLLPAMKLRLNEPAVLIDIGRIAELKGITNGSSLRIGALTTHNEIARSDAVQAACAALAESTRVVGDQQVRNWGTLGGNLAHADPASDPPPVIVAAGGTINVQGSSGSRSVGAEEFFIDLFTTDLQPDELITSIEIPDLRGAKTAYVKMAHPASGYAVVGVAVVLNMDGQTCSSARVAVGGATVKAVRSPGAETALAGSSLDDDSLNSAAAALKSDIEEWLIGDMSFPEEYRQQMAGVYLKRAVRAATG